MSFAVYVDTSLFVLHDMSDGHKALELDNFISVDGVFNLVITMMS